MVIRKCNICDRRFKKTEHFKRHERSHTKEKPYECSVCHKRFSRSDVLSRHAKGHNGAAATAPNGFKNGQPAAPSDAASIRRPSALPAEGQQFLPGAGAGAVNMVQPLSVASRDVSLPSATGLPPSSLDFLANVSTHHARTEPEVNPMMIDDHQQAAYFGWNEVSTTADTPAYRGPMFDTPNDLMQFWLEPRADAGSHNGSINLMPDSGFGILGENHGAFSERQERPSADSVGTPKSGSNIPSERFAKVQKCWVAPSNHNGRLINNLWQEVASIDLDNVFALHPGMSVNGSPNLLQGSRHGLDEECRQHLQAIFGYARLVNPHARLPEHHMTHTPNASGALVTLPNFPPAEVLDMALDLYFRNFHPLVPFIHVPTLSAKNTNPSVLYSMCLIGMIMLGTKGTTDFVSKNYTFVLEKITAELAKCSLGTESSANTMSTFAAAFLFLNLAAMTGEKEHLEKSQMLYISLISIAQRHGLFTATEGQILDMSFFEVSPDADIRWKTWSKIESVKRLISGLLLLDSWYSSFLSMSPIIVPDAIQLILPCNESLFQANSSGRWTHLIRSGRRILMPTVVAPSENVEIAALDSPVDDFCMHSILAMVQLRLSEAYHRLLSNRASYPFAPCHTYAMDGRARCLPSLQLQIASRYSDVLSHLNPNAAVMWHNMCMTLTADTQIFDLAAGRAGPMPAQKALEDIAAWSQTPAARRACLHAAQIYKAMINRKASDHTMFHSVFSLFSAALVLGLYEFMVPNTEGQGQGAYIELLDDVDWQAVGTEGFTSFMEPRGSQSFAPSDDPAVNFIRNGGVVYLRGVPFQGGYQSARRILLDYAGLLKDAGKWSVRKFSYVLHIMSDVLMDVE